MSRAASLRLLFAAAALFLLALIAACADTIPAAPPSDADGAALRPAPGDLDERRQWLRTEFQTTASVVVDGSIVHFRGVLNPQSVDHFFQQIRAAEEPIDTLVINSNAGEPDVSRSVGLWVHEHVVTVVVDHVCFSACANYIFTAAPRKIIRSGAIVGWHGSQQSHEYIAQARGLTVRELIDELVEQNLDQAVKDEAAAGGEARPELVRARLHSSFTALFYDTRAEQAFLDLIGVPVDALIYGLMPGRYDRTDAASVDGWTFTLEGMARLGIGNVTYEGPGEYGRDLGNPARTVIVFDPPPG